MPWTTLARFSISSFRPPFVARVQHEIVHLQKDLERGDSRCFSRPRSAAYATVPWRETSIILHIRMVCPDIGARGQRIESVSNLPSRTCNYSFSPNPWSRRRPLFTIEAKISHLTPPTYFSSDNSSSSLIMRKRLVVRYWEGRGKIFSTGFWNPARPTDCRFTDWWCRLTFRTSRWSRALISLLHQNW